MFQSCLTNKKIITPLPQPKDRMHNTNNNTNQPEKKSDTFFKFLKHAFFLLLILQIAPSVLSNLKKAIADSVSPKTNIGCLAINGVMADASFLEKQLQKFAKDDNIKGVIIKVNSPGGFPGTGQSIFNEIKRCKEKKPVVITIENLCASAAYYSAAAASHIVANPSAMVGSIGVLCELPNVKDLLNSWKISVNHVQSGEYKTTGSPVKEITQQELDYLQDISDNAYQQFIKDVAAARDLNPEEQKIWGNGKIFTGTQALELKLVDTIGSFYDGVAHMKQLLNIDEDEEIKLIRPKKPTSLMTMLGASDDDDRYQASLSNSAANFIHQTYQKVLQLQQQATPTIH
ncbi:MAG: Peptidase S49, SppA [candidate division TM6 bacterium GW2011_GWF2_38_10]|nr:MAG: Peptidase S49, SppA [candidate division TM6 bacterium GW2011_GWF2_38_10]